MSKRQDKKTRKAKERASLKRILALTSRVKMPLAIGITLSLISVLFDLAGPYLVGRILDNEISVHGRVEPKTFYLLLALYALAVLASALTRFLGQISNQKAANTVSKSVQKDIFRHVQKLPISYFDSLPAGKVVSRVTNDTQALRSFFQVVLSQILTAMLYSLGILLALASLDLSLLAIAALSFPALFLLFRDYRRKASRLNYQYRRGISELNASLNENIEGMEVIQAFGQERAMYDDFNRVNEYVYHKGLGMTHLFAYNTHTATGALNYLLLALALLYFGYGHLMGAYFVPVGHLYIFIDYMIRFFGQMNNAMTRLGELERSRSAADHVFELLDQPVPEFGGEPMPEMTGEIKFDDVTFAYKADEDVLCNINFTVEAGETAAFVGQTGSGKSTLMNLIFHYYSPQSGCILVDGKDIECLDEDDLRSHMAIVSQDPFLFAGTIESNITLGRKDLDSDDARHALIEVGGEHFLSKLKDGLATEVKEGGKEFSSGERQLISFARALAQNPVILILDEATSHVDTETESIIQRGIERLSEGRTTLIIAHRLSTIRHAENIYVLDQGHIVERGTHQELMQQKGIYCSMVAAQGMERNVIH
ncbi:MAG: ABC transporter ATP-binding protein [Eubacteriales bacterium]|nr:ABC transporter ATP-binding protein [Eubacteriales bacterium]